MNHSKRCYRSGDTPLSERLFVIRQYFLLLQCDICGMYGHAARIVIRACAVQQVGASAKLVSSKCLLDVKSL